MSDITDPLQLEEQQIFEREQEMDELERQVQQQETGLSEMQHTYAQRTKALVNLVSYVGEQERSLLA
ncbi:MAG: hypothetical protein QF464_12190, partial [Myxococcota bacterium]|nr:hypothetical protein [Myxococcota bacterium]